MMRKKIIFQILLILSLLGGKTLLGQSLFGSRGPVAQFGQGFPSQAPANSLSSIPVAGIWGGSLLGPTNLPGGRSVNASGNFSAANSFAGRQAASIGGDTSGSQSGPPAAQPESAARRALQVRPQISFRFEPLTQETIVSRLAQRFADIAAQRPDLARVIPQMTAPGHLVLCGEVDTEDSRKLAENVARFEPGVRSVENRLSTRNTAKRIE